MLCKVCGAEMGWDRPSGVCSTVCLRAGQGWALSYPERVELTVRKWDQWSPAERQRMDELVAEVLAHVANGTGNPFIASWCDRFAPKP